MKKIFIFPIVLIILSVNLFPVEPRDLNGGWLTESNYERLKNGDEFFVDQMRTTNIDGIEYWYCLVGTLIDLSSVNPRFCITNFNDFDVLNIKKISDITFELELKHRYDKTMTGKIRLTLKNSDVFYFEIIDGTDSFIKEINFFTINQNRWFRRLKQRK